MNLHMLGAYYTKGQDCDLMFQKLKISKTESYRTHLNNHNVVFIDFSRMPDGCRNYEDYVELAYMTGVLPIAKYSSGSGLNMYDEYSFMNDNIYDKYFGFSENEVRSLCESHSSVSYADLEYWYNGYYTATGDKLFNPRSVTKALTRGVCLSFQSFYSL